MYNISQAVNNMAFRERKNGLLEGRVSYKGERKSFMVNRKRNAKGKQESIWRKGKKGHIIQKR